MDSKEGSGVSGEVDPVDPKSRSVAIRLELRRRQGLAFESNG
jgi:hypothetical protein